METENSQTIVLQDFFKTGKLGFIQPGQTIQEVTQVLDKAATNSLAPNCFTHWGIEFHFEDGLLIMLWCDWFDEISPLVDTHILRCSLEEIIALFVAEKIDFSVTNREETIVSTTRGIRLYFDPKQRLTAFGCLNRKSTRNPSTLL